VSFLRVGEEKVGKIWAGGVAQVEEHLPSKCEALSSNPNTAKGKKKRQAFLLK
jgi:hypothetical protein